MRKFTVILLAIAFVAGFAMSASAADVSLTGQYYVKSLFEKNPALNGVSGSQEKALSLTHQRLRVQPEVAIADGLKLVMRFDALERAWGDKSWAGSSVDSASRASAGALTTTANATTGIHAVTSNAPAQENIEFERAYVDFNTGIGKFMVGYQNFAAWGTAFGDSHITRPGVKYILPIKDWVVIAAFEKGSSDYKYATKTPAMDSDMDILDLGAIYKLNNGEVGLLYQYVRNAAPRNFKTTGDAAIATATAAGANAATITALTASFASAVNQQHDSPVYINAFLPYYKGNFGGCVYVEVEGLAAFGQGYTNFDGTNLATAAFDRNAEGYGLYTHVKADWAPYYAGIMGVYMSGDDPGSAKIEGGLAKALLFGQVFAPTHMMWNDQFMTWTGIYNKNGASMDQFIDNAYFGYVYAGWKPSAKTDLKVAYALAKADKTGYGQSKDYGSELDFTATYSIYNNLQYEVGAGYFWVGDFFKGSTAAQVGNDYLLYHKLTLNF